ncbi:UNVERIFIED_CONTAM: hypothetical protein FKN15_034921 [Acipenser sinensis]
MIFCVFLGLPSGASVKGALRGVQDALYSLDFAGLSPGYATADRGRQLPWGGCSSWVAACSSTKAKQRRLDVFISCKPSCSVECANAVNNSIVNMIMKDLRPISIVGGEGFRNFLELLEPGYQLPSRTFFTQMIEKKYVDTMENIKAELKPAEKIVLTSDIWTSLAIEAYMSVTAHFITKE